MRRLSPLVLVVVIGIAMVTPAAGQMLSYPAGGEAAFLAASADVGDSPVLSSGSRGGGLAWVGGGLLGLLALVGAGMGASGGGGSPAALPVASSIAPSQPAASVASAPISSGSGASASPATGPTVDSTPAPGSAAGSDYGGPSSPAGSGSDQFSTLNAPSGPPMVPSDTQDVPEPGTLSVLGALALSGVGAALRRHRR